MKLLAAVLAAAAVWPLTTQADGRVDMAERRMMAAYTALADKLGGDAKVHLEADQARWLGDRRACDSNPPRQAECLESRYRGRTEMLAAIARGAYPFISQQTIVQAGTGPNGRYAVDIAYPRFDGQSADFAEPNRRFVAAAETERSHAIDTGRNCEITQTFSLYRPVSSVVSVTFWREWAGATISIDLAGYLVDLSTGRMLEPQDVFALGDEWRHRLAELVGQELARDPPDPWPQERGERRRDDHEHNRGEGLSVQGRQARPVAEQSGE